MNDGDATLPAPEGGPKGAARAEISDHELLGPIGGGSYGEVWLARSATGIYRAVKVLQRARFGANQEPFEREFEGLRRFEPVSRAHKHVVDVLHIGCHDEMLYYVMELADDASGTLPSSAEFDPAAYIPDTLSGRLGRRGRFPINDCVEIARSLALALQHLHSNGLIHRDVKPPNVVFVDGVLKLADVGLVSATEATVSMVGTEGYIPPEGPGTMQADLFALGKILYEISSGLDRMEFPAAPAWVCQESEGGRWSEFNEIVLGCCEKDPDRRYATSGEILSDLEWLEGGGSLVKRRRRREGWHLTKIGTACTLAAGTLFALGAVLNPWGANPGPSQVAPRWQLVESTLNLGGLDFPLNRHRHREWDFSPDGTILAIKDQRTVVVRTSEGGYFPALAENPEGWELSNPRWLGDTRSLVCLAWSPASIGPERRQAILLLDVEQQTIRRTIYETPFLLNRMSLSPATRTLVVLARGDGPGPKGLLEIKIDDGTVSVLSDAPGRRVGEFSPDGTWLALYPVAKMRNGRQKQDVWLLAPADGRTVRITDRKGFAGYPTWSADGRSLYYVAGDSLEGDATLNLWKVGIDPISGEPVGQSRQVTFYRDNQVLFPQVLAESGKIAAAVANVSKAVWSAPTASPGAARLLVTGVRPLLSSDGEWVYYLDRKEGREGVYRILTAGPAEAQRLTHEVPLSFDVSPAGNALVAAHSSPGRVTIFAWDLIRGEQRELISISGEGGVCVKWSPDGKHLAYTDGPGLFLMEASGSSPQLLGRIEDWDENVWEGWLIWSPDGSMIAAYGYPDAGALEDEINHVYVADVSGGNLRSVTDFETDAYYKEGLRWHPRGDRLTYMIYGPGPDDSQVRQANPDGSSTRILVNQERHWDWVGTWHPNGNDYYFASFGDDLHESSSHILRLDTGEIVHTEAVSSAVTLPQWSANGERVMWATHRATKELRLLEELKAR